MGLKQFDIELSKLRQGKNQYEYRLDTAFFESSGNRSIRKADVEVTLELDKAEVLINLQFQIRGQVDLNCEKCLAVYHQDVNSHAKLLVKITDDELPEGGDDEIIYLSRKEVSFNIAQHLYDFTVLALPFVKVCSDPGNLPGCDREMLDRLSRMKGGEDGPNDEGRWDKLKDLLSNN